MHDASSQLERAHENTDQGQFHLKKKHDKKNRVVEKSELKALTNTNTKGHKKERTVTHCCEKSQENTLPVWQLAKSCQQLGLP